MHRFGCGGEGKRILRIWKRRGDQAIIFGGLLASAFIFSISPATSMSAVSATLQFRSNVMSSWSLKTIPMDPATQSRKSSGVIAAADTPAPKSGLNFRHRRGNDDCGNKVGFTSMNFKLYSSVRTINIGIALIVTSAPT